MLPSGPFEWAQVVALSTFVLGYFVKWAIDAHEKRNNRRRFYRALVTEIRLNLQGLEETVPTLLSLDTINDFLAKDVKNRPHLISQYISIIFDGSNENLRTIPSIVTRNIIEFYDLLGRIDKTVDSFERKSFETISLGGKQASVQLLRKTLQDALQKGKALTDLISRELGVD